MYGRKEGVLKGWEVGENNATMLNVSQSNKGYRMETKKKRGGAGNARYEILEVSNSPPPPPPSPCTGSPFYNCLPFPQLRTSTRIHRLFSVVFIGSCGLKTTHRAGAGMVRFVLTTLSPLKWGPKNSLKEKEKWKRVSTVCIHLPVRQNITIIGQIIRKPRYFLVFLTFRPSSAARTSVKVILSVLTNSKYWDTDLVVLGIPCTDTRSTVRLFKPFYCKEKNIENQW